MIPALNNFDVYKYRTDTGTEGLMLIVYHEQGSKASNYYISLNGQAPKTLREGNIKGSIKIREYLGSKDGEFLFNLSDVLIDLGDKL